MDSMTDTTTTTTDPLLLPPNPPRINTATSVRTYVVGEDAGRLASAAQFLGLTVTDSSGESSQQRKVQRPVREAAALMTRNLFWNDSTVAFTAARMHSVGAIGSNEVVDNGGTLHLHYISRRRRQRPTTALQQQQQQRVPSYGTLTDLFQKEDKTTPASYAMEIQQQQVREGEEESESEEIVVIDIVEGGSLNAAIFGIVKGTVGPAILYLPRGFELSGYAIAIPAMLFATAMYIYNAHLLLQCWKVESDRNHKIAQRMEEVRALLEESAPAPANTAVITTNGNSSSTTTTNNIPQFTPKLLSYPELAHRALGPFAILVEFGIASMQFGVCLTYLIFVPQNLHECLYSMTNGHADIPKIYFLVFMVLVEIPLSWIRDIRKLTPTNVVATMLIAYGLVSVLVIAMMTGFAPASDGGGFVFQENLRALPATTDTWFIFIGTSFFMMEGSITLLVPLQEAVYTPDDKAKFPRVNQVVTSWIVVFYICFSMTCVAAFGTNIHTALTASLKGSLATTVQLAYSIAVIFTFPLQAFPALEVAMKALLPGSSSSILISSSSSLNKEQQEKDNNVKILKRNALATWLTCLLGVIAVIAIDYLGNVVSILGSLFGIPLALVFPPLMHNNLVLNSSRNNTINAMDRSATLSSSSLWERISSSTTIMRYTNYCVVVIGFFAMGAASFATIVSWDKGAEGG